MSLESAAAADEPDDKCDSADDNEDDGSIGDQRVGAADVDDILIADDRWVKFNGNASSEQGRTA